MPQFFLNINAPAGYPGSVYATHSGDSAYGYKLSWMDRINPYVKNVQIFKCPSGVPHMVGTYPGAFYGYNGYLGGRNVSTTAPVPTTESALNQPASIPLIVDASYSYSSYVNPLEMNSSTGRQAGCFVHNDGANIGFCDGHVKWLSKTDGLLVSSARPKWNPANY